MDHETQKLYCYVDETGQDVSDESEPVIRLADMWAGCIRAAFLGEKEAKEIFEAAKRTGYLIEVTG